MQDRRHYHHGYLKERLLELGDAALRENTLGQTSLRDLAKLAGVSHSAPYRHFADRAALEMALLEKEMSQLLEIARVIDTDVQLSGLDRFKDLGQKLIQLSANNPHRFELLMTPKDKKLSDGLSKFKFQLSRILLRWTVDALHVQRRRQDFEPIEALKLIWALIAGAIKVGQSHWTQDSKLDSRDEAYRILDTSLSAIFKT